MVSVYTTIEPFRTKIFSIHAYTLDKNIVCVVNVLWIEI